MARTSDHPTRRTTAPVHFDVLVVGAGPSGIGAASRLRTKAPGVTFGIVAARGAGGGARDLFWYPGVRSE